MTGVCCSALALSEVAGAAMPRLELHKVDLFEGGTAEHLLEHAPLNIYWRNTQYLRTYIPPVEEHIRQFCHSY